MEICLSEYFNARINTIVPNISWGMGMHEVDLLVLTPAGYAYEIEIKISKVDLLADLKKRHGHRSTKISKLYFAIPDYLQCSADRIPKHAGILIISEVEKYSWLKDNAETFLKVECVRDPQNKGRYKFTEKERINMLRLGAMRIWTLKKKIQKYQKTPKQSTYDANKVNKALL